MGVLLAVGLVLSGCAPSNRDRRPYFHVAASSSGWTLLVDAATTCFAVVPARSSYPASELGGASRTCASAGSALSVVTSTLGGDRNLVAGIGAMYVTEVRVETTGGANTLEVEHGSFIGAVSGTVRTVIAYAATGAEVTSVSLP